MNRPLVGDLADGWLDQRPDLSLHVRCVDGRWVVRIAPLNVYRAISLVDALELAGRVVAIRDGQS